MRNILAVVKKDLDKIFKFPRMIFSTILLPGVLIFLIYSLMGNSLSNMIEETEERYSVVFIDNAPESFQGIISNSQENAHIEFTEITNETKDDLEASVLNENIDIAILFEEDFDHKLEAYLADIENSSKPSIEIFVNTNSTNSTLAFSKMQTLVTTYKDQMIEGYLNEYNLTSDLFTFTSKEIVDEKKSGGLMLAGLLPMLIITFIFSGSLGYGADAIAGEKERGTLSTLLMAPIRKTDIISGKLISTSITSVLTALSSFIGVLASMPFAKQMFFEGDVSLNYGATHYLGLLVIFLIVAFMASSLILVASTFGKSVKEATSYAMPLLIIAMIVAVVSMFSEKLPTGVLPYLLPIYNATLGLKGLLSFQLTLTQFLLIIGSSLVFIALITYILVKLFKSEKVIFSK